MARIVNKTPAFTLISFSVKRGIVIRPEYNESLGTVSIKMQWRNRKGKDGQIILDFDKSETKDIKQFMAQVPDPPSPGPVANNGN